MASVGINGVGNHADNFRQLKEAKGHDTLTSPKSSNNANGSASPTHHPQPPTRVAATHRTEASTPSKTPISKQTSSPISQNTTTSAERNAALKQTVSEFKLTNKEHRAHITEKQSNRIEKDRSQDVEAQFKTKRKDLSESGQGSITSENVLKKGSFSSSSSGLNTEELTEKALKKSQENKKSPSELFEDFQRRNRAHEQISDNRLRDAIQQQIRAHETTKNSLKKATARAEAHAKEADEAFIQQSIEIKIREKKVKEEKFEDKTSNTQTHDVMDPRQNNIGQTVTRESGKPLERQLREFHLLERRQEKEPLIDQMA